MSLGEIKTALRSLTATELADIEKPIGDLQRTPEDNAPAIRVVQPSDPDVAAAMDEIFDTHRELFHRLAQ